MTRRKDMAKIIKRDGSEDIFQEEKIVRAIEKANAEVEETKRMFPGQIESIAHGIQAKIEHQHMVVNVEDIQDMVETGIMEQGAYEVAKQYITYRYRHELVRKSNTTDAHILSLINDNNEEAKRENANKNPTINSTQRDYMAGEVSRDLSRRILLPKEIVEAHDKGIIHMHDLDYFANREFNCCLIDLENMLQNGTVISGTMIEKPHSFSTACNVATQIIAQIASNQYGGQSISLSHLAPFVDISRQKIKKEVKEELESCGNGYTEADIGRIVEKRVDKEIQRGVQTIQYQVLTLLTVNGQAPFVTVFMYLDEVPAGQLRDDLAKIIKEVILQRYQGVKNEKGIWITPAFPKLIYVLDEDNIEEGTPYWELTELAAKCTARRLVPDYISAKVMRRLKEGVFPPMGCRSCLAPWKDANGNYKWYGRFNQGVCTLNLVDIACSSAKNEAVFWSLFQDRLDLCFAALMCRHNRLKGTLSDVSPVHWQNGAIARLEKGTPIDDLLYGGYSTISLGYAGLWECVYYMTGNKLTDPKGKEFGLRVMQYMNEACERWKEKTNIGFGIYGTPLESTTYKFAKCLQKRFGKIPGVTDRNYITNSYHVHVTEPIDAFSKLKLESEFQSLSTGGAISYVEVPNMQNNIPAVLAVMKFIYNNIMYAELNVKSDYCQVCGYDGEIKIVEDDGKLVWECPNCKNRDERKMNVARRTCGYIGTSFFNQGRTQEIKERVLHL